MASASQQQVAAKYWGYLIQPDRSPSPVLEQLLSAVANYIKEHVAPWNTVYLTPAKLGHFYRLVGGDYDSLFLDTPHTSLSFIYRSLGCFHTLHPEKDPYAAPSVPALTTQGFVRWQTVQLLLDPSEHVPFLQESVKRFDLTNPMDREAFPCVLPRTAMPTKPDPDMSAWYAAVSEKLMLEAQASQQRSLPQRPPMAALSDGDDSSRPTSADSHSVESQSLIDAASYFQQPSAYGYSPPAPPSFGNKPTTYRARSSSKPYDRLCSPHQGRTSYPRPQQCTGQEVPRSTRVANSSRTPRTDSHFRARAPRTVSSTSCSSDCSSSTSTSVSLSPSRHHAPLQSSSARRPSSNPGPSVPPHRAKSHPDVLESSNFPQSIRSTVHPDTKGLNVRWRDQGYGDVHPSTSYDHLRPSSHTHSSRNHLPGQGLNRAKSVEARPARGTKGDLRFNGKVH